VLHLSVLDGWWVEGFEGANGWAIEGSVAADPDAQDDRHAEAFLDLVEHEIVPLFYERDAEGIPRRWMQMVKASIRTAGLRFTAQRMLREYVERVYQTRPAGA
jgi:starch phosphorylase